jgi:hypothetical protein
MHYNKWLYLSQLQNIRGEISIKIYNELGIRIGYVIFAVVKILLSVDVLQ